jgi:ribosome biogenesis GTPase
MPSPVTLEDLGWDTTREEEFAEIDDDALAPGRVSLEHNHVYRVLTATGEHLAESAGRLKHRAEGRQALPVVGDWVALRLEATGARRQIRAILPRRTWLSRKVAGRETEEQVLGANIDVVFLVFGLDGGVKPRRQERYLLAVERSGATPVIVLNKSDEDPHLATSIAAAEAASSGRAVIASSAVTGAGFDRLAGYLTRGRTLALLGPSGAGKSSIVNRLVGETVLPTGLVRARDLRGRHTSVHRQLVVRPAGGVILDTPGMRELQLWDTDALAESFTDIGELARRCRFRDCQHDREPGCAVKAAVDRGELDRARYQGYLKLQAEQTALVRKRDELSQGDQKRTAKIANKSLRRFYKDR